MRFVLRDFQKKAVRSLLDEIYSCHQELQRTEKLQVVTFSAPTASGKTVMMTSLIERILFAKGGLDEEDDPDFPTQPDAVFLWLSDSPQLNQQSLEKLSVAASAELVSRIEIVDQEFDQETFNTGHVYFLNSQKLSVSGLLTKKGDDRTYSIWETVNNTIRSQPNKFYVIIDEAHRGMRQGRNEEAEARSIIQKFIFGSQGELIPAPIIIGVSATPERFDEVLRGTRRTRRGRDIPANEPREAGLIKDFILIGHDEDDQPTEWTLLAASCKEFKHISEEWDRYCSANKEPDPVRPVLVLQIEDGEVASTSRTSLARLIEIVKIELPELRPLNFAHCLESGKTLDIFGFPIRYIEPSRIEHDEYCRVVIFKMALTTGWDCPRAEVMMSFRRAEDATYIAQLVGRIVRTPLARRMVGNDLLNSVMLFLPHYDRTQVQKVVEKLQGEGGETKGPEAGDQDDFQTLKVSKGKQDLLDHYRKLPTYSAQDGRKTTDIRRALRFAGELAFDEWREEAAHIRKYLLKELLRIGGTKRRDAAFTEKLKGLSNVSYRIVRVVNGVLKAEDKGEPRTLAVTEQDVQTVFTRSFSALTEGLATDYATARFDPEDQDSELWRCKLEVFLLSQDESVFTEVEKLADGIIDQVYEKLKSQIRNKPEERQAAYRRIMQTSRHFKATEPAVPDPLRIKTDADWKSLPDHLYVSEKGDFKAYLNTWEEMVLTSERNSQGFAGWLRNSPRKPWSIAYIYESAGTVMPGYPDFIIFRRQGRDIVADLLEPHFGADALAKAKGLCRFAEEHGGKFGKIEWIQVRGDQIKRLALNKRNIREKVLATSVDGAIDSLFEAFGT
jgi:type III restriction enzyme